MSCNNERKKKFILRVLQWRIAQVYNLEVFSWLAKQLIKLLPKDISQLLDDQPSVTENIGCWLKQLMEESAQGRSMSITFKDDQIRRLEQYRLEGLDDLVTLLNLIRQAWAGLIEIKIDQGHDQCTVSFRVPGYEEPKHLVLVSSTQ